jgi:prephenate dehydratase|tara:strand:- start:895 stop:1113 length:219 start_codon:yes stop_codon:yes gene_type:complete
MITKDTIAERRTKLESDIEVLRQKLQNLEKQRIEAVGLVNALTGALQQCDEFLKQIDNVEPEVVSDSSDVDN